MLQYSISYDIDPQNTHRLGILIAAFSIIILLTILSILGMLIYKAVADRREEHRLRRQEEEECLPSYEAYESPPPWSPKTDDDSDDQDDTPLLPSNDLL